MSHKLYHGDCLDVMPTLEAAGVDAVICDPPYGTTNCKWDSVIPLEAMWREIGRVLKPKGVAVFTASQPFTSLLVVSKLEWFRYEWIWEKKNGSGYLDANRKPTKCHENIVVFCRQGAPYHPKMVRGPFRRQQRHGNAEQYGKHTRQGNGSGGLSYPRSVLRFDNPRNNREKHPTSKPVPLMAYLIKTYTKEGDTVLDFCMGSGSTGVAAIQTGRSFIGIEKDEKYFTAAKRRIDRARFITTLF